MLRNKHRHKSGLQGMVTLGQDPHEMAAHLQSSLIALQRQLAISSAVRLQHIPDEPLSLTNPYLTAEMRM